jgi:serine/threonine protein kinase
VVKEAPYSHATTEQTSYILKRMYVQDNVFIKECSNREIYFGELFRVNSWASPPQTTTLIEHFVDRDSMWLVFKESGLSLQYLLYDYKHSQGAMIEPSKFWYKLRSDSKGPRFLKQLMFKIITEVHNLHSAGIVHRDIKPGNILIEVSEDAITHKSKLNVIISDFSSAYHSGIDSSMGMPLDRPEYANLTTRTDLDDAERLARASSADDIALSQLSLDYAPPEVRLFPTFCNYESRGDCNMSSDSSAPRKACFPKHRRGLMSSYDSSYDVWSIGVTFMEIILAIHGSKQGNDIFSVSSSRQSIILQRIRTLFRKRHLDSKAEDLTFSKKKCHSFLNDLHDGEIGTVSRSVFAAALSDYCIMHTNLVQLPSTTSSPTPHDMTGQSPQTHTPSPLLPAPSSQLLSEETTTISQPVITLEIASPVADVCSAATALVPFPILNEESSSTSATSRLNQLIDNFEMALVVR